MRNTFPSLFVLALTGAMAFAADPAPKPADTTVDVVRQSLQKKDFSGKGGLSGKFFQVRMDDTNFAGVTFKKAVFEQCYLVGTNMKGAKFDHGTKFYLVMMNGANLQGADFLHAKLDTVNLRRSNLSGTKNINSLRRVNLDNTNLRGADLSKLKLPLQEVTLTGAIYDKTTKFPDGFDPAKAGAKLAK